MLLSSLSIGIYNTEQRTLAIAYVHMYVCMYYMYIIYVYIYIYMLLAINASGFIEHLCFRNIICVYV